MTPCVAAEASTPPEPPMKFGTYLMLNVLLVGGGILVYDTVRSDRHETSRPAEVASIDRSTDPAATTAESESPIVLAGGGEAAVLAQFQELKRRIAILEQSRGGTAGSTGGGENPAGRSASTDAPADAGGVLYLPDTGSVEDPRFDAVTLERFKAYKDKVDQLERDKRTAEFVNGQIEALKLNLSTAQQEAVVAATVKYQTEARRVIGVLPRGARGPEERQKAVGDLREQYTKTIAAIVPAADAEKIVNSVARFGGRGDGGDQAGQPGGRIRGQGGNPQGGQTPR